MAATYPRLIHRYIFKHQTAFSARFDKQDEDGQIPDEIETCNNLGKSRNLTENNIDNLNVRFQLEHQILNQEMNDSGWRIDKIISMTKS